MNGWINLLPVRFGGSFTSSAGHGCPNGAGQKRHRRHLGGTPATPDRPAIYAIYATYDIYVQFMLSADTAASARCRYEGSRSTAQSLKAGPISVLKTHFLAIFPVVSLLVF